MFANTHSNPAPHSPLPEVTGSLARSTGKRKLHERGVILAAGSMALAGCLPEEYKGPVVTLKPGADGDGGSDFESFSGNLDRTGPYEITMEDERPGNPEVIQPELTFEGAGTATFRFQGSEDSVILAEPSAISGFEQLRVISGTLDLRQAEADFIRIDLQDGARVRMTAEQAADMAEINGNGEIVIDLGEGADELEEIFSVFVTQETTGQALTLGPDVTITLSGGGPEQTSEIDALLDLYQAGEKLDTTIVLGGQPGTYTGNDEITDTYAFSGDNIGNVVINDFDAEGGGQDILDFSAYEKVENLGDLIADQVGDDVVLSGAVIEIITNTVEVPDPENPGQTIPTQVEEEVFAFDGEILLVGVDTSDLSGANFNFV